MNIQLEPPSQRVRVSSMQILKKKKNHKIKTYLLVKVDGDEPRDGISSD